jgi:hypothetical protein
VTEYVDKFSTLVDQLVAYESNANLLYYAMRFVDGLREDIKAIVMIHSPSMLDATCALALVQEEELDSNKKREYKRYEPIFNRQVHRSVSSAPVLPRFDKS